MVTLPGRSLTVNRVGIGQAQRTGFSMDVGIVTGTLANQRYPARIAWVVSGWRGVRATRKSLVFWHDAAPLVGPGILRLPGAPYALGKTSSLAAAPTSHAPISLVVLRPVVLASVRRG